ncbi:MAG: hypothetical protein IJA05_05955 [Oscillospiraceae bacterium]|nr:hypothetical protein [Oscillospiraceae bacterium]
MTVKECYEHAVSFLPEKPEENTEMQKFAVVWCNILLAETMRNENVCRKAKGQEELKKVPLVKNEEDEIPYDEEMVRAAFPYGMARFVFRENDDISGSHEFYQLYVNALLESTPVIESEVEDVYG